MFMSPENRAKLINAFPRLYRLAPDEETKDRWELNFECGDGWFDLLWCLSVDLDQLAQASGVFPDSDM